MKKKKKKKKNVCTTPSGVELHPYDRIWHRQDSQGLGSEVKALKTFEVVPSLLGSDPPQYYLTQRVFKVVLQKSTPPQIRHLILYYY